MSLAPTLERILEALPLNEPHLNRLALSEKGLEEAEAFAVAVFGTQFGDEIQSTLASLAAQTEEVKRLDDELEAAKDHRDSLERSLPLSDEEKKPMTVWTILVQVGIALAIAFLLMIGCHNFAVLLIKHGEPFLTHPWMAYLTSLGAATAFAFIVKAAISIPKRDELKRMIAGIALCVGVVAGLLYLAILSHIVRPDFNSTNIDQLIPALGSSRPATSESASAHDGDFGNHWLLFFQFVAESTGAAGLGYFFARNMADHRAACARRNPEHKEAVENVEKAAARAKAAKSAIGELEGTLLVFGKAREMFTSMNVTRVLAFQRLIRTVFVAAAIKPVDLQH